MLRRVIAFGWVRNAIRIVSTAAAVLLGILLQWSAQVGWYEAMTPTIVVTGAAISSKIACREREIWDSRVFLRSAKSVSVKSVIDRVKYIDLHQCHKVYK